MPSSGLLISWAMPAAQPADGGEPLRVEQLALQVAHARLLVRHGLHTLAPAYLAQGQAAQQHRQGHAAQVERQGRPLPGRARLASNATASRSGSRRRASRDPERTSRPRARTRPFRSASRPRSPAAACRARSFARRVLESAAAPLRLGQAQQQSGRQLHLEAVRGGVPIVPVGQDRREAGAGPARSRLPRAPWARRTPRAPARLPRRPTSRSGVPSGARTARRTTEGWLRSETSSALSAASRSASAAAPCASFERRAMEDDAARNVRLDRTSASVCSRERAWASVSRELARDRFLGRAAPRQCDVPDRRRR